MHNSPKGILENLLPFEVHSSTFCQKVEIFVIFGPRSHHAPGYDWRKISHGPADPRASRVCQISRESVQRVAPAGDNADFWPVSKFNTGSLPLRGNLTGN